MRITSGIVLSAAVLALAVGCGKKDATTASGGDSVSIEGVYILTGMEMGGEKMPDEFLNKGKEEDRTITITGDKIIAKKQGKDDPSSYTIDKSKSPAHIDMVEKKMDGKDEKSLGIFKLEGDTLTICAVESDKAEERPKEFKTEKAGKSMIMTLKKKAK